MSAESGGVGGVPQSVTPAAVAMAGGPPVTIHKFSSLDARVQAVALEAIASINKETSTDEGKSTWEGYTAQIRDRLDNCENAKDTLFIACVGDQVVGYSAFYTLKDKVPYPSKFLDDEGQAYCSWTAVDKDFQGKGIATELKLHIFSPESGFTAFKGHIKKANTASLRVMRKFAEKGFNVVEKKDKHQVYYTISKPPG